jgi:ATP-dependent Clp protease protease subunit
MYEQKSNEDITLIINSDGGYINDCFALIDIMDSSKCDIGVVVLGIAASAACLIASNGTQGKRVAGKNSEFMFHEVTGFPYEIKKSDLEYIKKETVKHQKKFSQIFARNTGQAIRTIEKIFYGQKDRYMNSSEAKQFGIVDKILIQRKREKIVKKTKSQKNGAKND